MNYVTFTTSGSLRLCKNLLMNLRELNLEKDFTVYCLDEKSFSEISKADLWYIKEEVTK